jgi:hypothetical protein
MKNEKQYYVEVTGLNELGVNELNEFYKYNIEFNYINPYRVGRLVTNQKSKYFSNTKNFGLESTFISLKAKVDENGKKVDGSSFQIKLKHLNCKVYEVGTTTKEVKI